MARARTAARASLVVCLFASGASASLPTGQQSADIGSPAIAGSATYQTGKYTIKAAGADIWGAADQFHFVYLPVTGDVDLRVRVTSLVHADVWSKAGIMIRESLTADARHAFATTSAGAGYAFQRRPDPGADSEHTSGGTGAPPGWVRLVRTASQFQAYRSADGLTWTSMGTDIITMAGTVYVGLAVTSHSKDVTTTAVFDNLTVLQTTQPKNKPPIVGLTSPTPGATYTAPANIVMTANASDPEGRLAGVDFFLDGVLAGTAAAAPFSITEWAVPAGAHTVTAIVRDRDGASTEAAPVSVTVAAAGGASTPFKGSPVSLPGTLQVEDFDNGGEGVAYHDNTWGNAGNAYRMTNADIASTYDTTWGHTLGWVGAGEWLNYSVTVAAAGTYTIEVRVASAAAGGTFHIEAKGVDVTGPLTVPGTGGWQTWTTVRKDGVSLSGGSQVWRLVMDSNGATSVGNFNWIKVSAGGATSAPRAVAFKPSPDHATLVTSYVLRVFAAGANPQTATPLASSSLGKPSPNAAGEIVVDRAAFFSALPPGSYVSAVGAVGPAGETLSPGVTFTR